MNNCLGIIMGGHQAKDLTPLTEFRPLSMLPFGGRYRLVDFTMSNMVHNGINTVAIYTGEKIRSMMDHLGNGKPWDLNRRFKGLFIFPPLYSSDLLSKYGELGDFFSTETFFKQAREEYVLLADPRFLHRVNLSQVFQEYVDSGADVAMIYQEVTGGDGGYFHATTLRLNDDKRVLSLGYNLGHESSIALFLGLTFIKKDLLMDLIYRSIENGTARSLREAITNNREELRVIGIPHQGHVEYIHDIHTYYRANMNLLDNDVYEELFCQDAPVLTKAKDEPSTYYGKDARVENSLVANGCIIEGEVVNSILFRGVVVGKGTLVKNSILMQKTTVGEDAAIINSITDKYVVIDDHVTLAGTTLAPYVAGKEREIKRIVNQVRS